MSDFDRWMARLSAEDRAQLSWARPRIEAALRRLQTEPLTSELIRDASKQVLTALIPVLCIVASAPAEGGVLTSVWQEKIPQLREYLGDSAAADAAEWAMRAVTAFYDLIAAVAMPSIREKMLHLPPSDEVEAEIDRELSAPGASIMFAQVLVMAILDAAENGVDPARGELLADEAVLAVADGLDELARQGVHLDPLQGASPAERGARAVRYAGHVRRALSENDIESIGRARIRSLR